MSADHLQSFFSCLEPIHPDIDTNQFLNDIRQSTFDSQFYNNHADVDSYLSPKSPELDASSISSGSDEFNTSSGSLSLSPTSNIVSMLNSNVHYLHSQHQPLPQSSVTSMTTDASPMHLGLGLSEIKTPTPAPAAVLSYGLPLNGNLMVCAPSPVSSVGSSPDSNGISAGMNGIKLKVEMPSPLATPMPAGMPPPPPVPNGLSTPASTSGSSSGVPVDTDTIRELLKEQGVKRQRLARKAELARLSRKRKKTRLGELEGEVAILKEELERERKSRKAAEDSLIVAQQQARISQALAAEADQSAVFSDIAVAEESKQLHDAIRRGFASNAPPQEIARLASEVVNVVKKRQNNVAHQMKQVQKHVTPSLPLRFLEWALNQKDQFYEDNSGLWNSLFVREVGLSPEQLQAIMSLRQNMQLQRNSGLEVQNAYAKLIAAFQTQASQTTASLDKFVSLLSHEQLAKFFAWVDTYGSVCVQINI